MRSFAPNHLDRLMFTAGDVAALTQLAESRGKQALFVHQVPESLLALRNVAIIESSESSNRLEGVVAPRARIEAVVLRPTAAKDRDEQEIAGYRDALSLVHESHAAMPFSANVLLQLHGLLFRYQPRRGGSLKQGDNEIVEYTSDGQRRIRFQPTPALQTPAALDQLVAGYHDAVRQRALHPLVAVPLAILDFLCIHPFDDGNGRVARLLTLLLLYQHSYEVGRYISLERVIEDSKTSYYETLQHSSQGWHEGAHDTKPWMQYFWGVLQRASLEFEERVGALGEGSGKKSARIRAAIDRRRGPFSSTDIERDCPGISHQMVRLVLRQLRDQNQLRVEGKGRGARWHKNASAT